MKAILAVASDYAIGYQGGLPWSQQSSDLQYFKSYTMQKKCIVGRKTFEGLGKLPGRDLYVVTRSPEKYEDEDGITYVRLEDIPKDGIIIGGKEIYEALIHECEEVSVTIIKAEGLSADTYFNPFPFIEKELSDVFKLPQNEKNVYPSEVFVFN